MTTATKTRPARTADKASGAAVIDWRDTLIEAVNAPGALGNTYNRFYNYSFLNQIRLMMQGVMEPVATYNRWQSLGRQVRKGSKAKMVLAPIMITKQVEKDGVPVIVDGKPVKRQVLVGFRDSRTVFTFTDTDGDELPAVELPGWDSDTALAALGIDSERFAEIDGNKAGYSYADERGKHVAINPVAVYPAKTLLHEVAHLVLGHSAQPEEYAAHRGVFEFEAEATAYLVAKELELVAWDPAESRDYIQSWLTDKTGGEINFDKHAGRIFAAANKILVAGRPVKTDVA